MLTGAKSCKTVTKKEIIDRISERTGVKRTDVKDVVQMFLDEIVHELEGGNRLEFRDFGVFEVNDRAARMAQNPKTLERVPVPAKRTVKFKPGKKMRELVHPSELDSPQIEIKIRKPKADGATIDGKRDGHRDSSVDRG